MGKLVFGMMQSLDGYISGVAGGPQLPPPGDRLQRHFNDLMHRLAAVVYGRGMYEVMRYWDEDQADWDSVERDFAAAWRAKPVWVASHTLQSVGPNATLIQDDAGAFVRKLKADVSGEIGIAGPEVRRPSHRARLDRRVSPLRPPVRARPWQAVLLRSSAATPHYRHGKLW